MGSRSIGAHLHQPYSTEVMLTTLSTLNPGSCFQLFSYDHKRKTYPRLMRKTVERISHLIAEKNISGFLHASFRISGAHGLSYIRKKSLKDLVKELSIVERLGMKALVLHPGSCGSKTPDRQSGALRLAELLDHALERVPTAKVLLENAHQSGPLLGGNLKELALIREFSRYPDRIKYCLDTAHAHTFGYNLSNPEGFLTLIKSALGFENIDLIHLNNAITVRGSQRDQHASLSKGNIPLSALKTFAMSPQLKRAPLLLELPRLAKREVAATLDLVNQWHYEQPSTQAREHQPSLSS